MPLVISVGTLGSFAMPDFCPRCFWIRLKAEKLPFQIPMPGIFSSIDSYVKNVVRRYYDKEKKLPRWFPHVGEIANIAEVPSYKEYYFTEPQSGVTLRGTPDEVFQLKDGSFHIVDYKTSRFTATQGGLFPMYEVQLNAYAVIEEQCGLKPITDLALVYMEPVTDGDAAADDANRRNDGFAMGFTANIHKVTLNLGIIPPLLMKTREIYAMDSAPSGHTGCHDCQLLEELLEVAEK